MRKMLLIFFLLASFFASCRHPLLMTNIPGPKVKSVTITEMTLVVGREVPIVVYDQNGENVTNSVKIQAVNPEKAIVKTNGTIKAKVAGDIDIKISFGVFEQIKKLHAILENTILTNPSIGIIQSPAHISPYTDMKFENLEAIVTQIDSEGFYVQSLVPDDFCETSEGIFVYCQKGSTLKPGNIVSLDGIIKEHIAPGDENKKYLSTTVLWVNSQDIGILGAEDIPNGVDLSKRIPPQRLLSRPDDVNNYTHVFDCQDHGMDFWESLEGMLITVKDPKLVATYDRGNIVVVDDRGVNAGPFSARGGLVTTEEDCNPEKIVIKLFVDEENKSMDDWAAPIGSDFTRPITAPLGFDTSLMRPVIDAAGQNTDDLKASLIHHYLEKEKTYIDNDDDKLTVATFNIEEYNISNYDKTEEIAKTIVGALACPDIVAIQGMQDDNGLEGEETSRVVSASKNAATVIQAIKNEHGVNYTYVDIEPMCNADGGAPGGNRRVAYLYNSERVTLNDAGLGKGSATSPVVIVEGNDGQPIFNHNPARITGSAFSDSSKPLVANFVFNGENIYLVNVHFMTKKNDKPEWGHIQPVDTASSRERLWQGKDVSDFVDNLVNIDSQAKIVVLGDFNDFVWSPAANSLMANGLDPLAETKLGSGENYNYNRLGNSYLRSEFFVSRNMFYNAEVDIVHRYSEYTGQHFKQDPIIASFEL